MLTVVSDVSTWLDGILWSRGAMLNYQNRCLGLQNLWERHQSGAPVVVLDHPVAVCRPYVGNPVSVVWILPGAAMFHDGPQPIRLHPAGLVLQPIRPVEGDALQTLHPNAVDARYPPKMDCRRVAERQFPLGAQ